jgi:hypothetical protein
MGAARFGRYSRAPVHTPYADHPTDAFRVAHLGLTVTLGAYAWASARPGRPRVLLAAAIAGGGATAAFVQLLPTTTEAFPVTAALGLALSALCAAAYCRALGGPRRVVGAIAEAAAVLVALRALPGSAAWVASAHMGWLAVLAAAGDEPAGAPAPAPRHIAIWLADGLCFLGAFLLATLVCVVVLERFPSIADEWTYTFQADLFAHGAASAPVPPCSPAFDNDWIFAWQGRAFSQFTPGWPLAMAPFVALGVPWAAAPVAHGALAVGVARVTRRLYPDDARGTDGERVSAGVLAALLVSVGACALLNAGSRFPHTLEAALFAWAVEAACALMAAGEKRAAVQWGVVLGVAVAWMIAVRPPDGVVLSAAIVCATAVAAFRAGPPRAGAFAAASAASLVLVLMLVILRAQLGVWFRTGYSLTATLQPWATLALGLPPLADVRHSLPLDVGAYCFWPCAPALGVAGLVSRRRHAPTVVGMLGAGAAMLFAFYFFVSYTRQEYWSYGPRYQLPALVAMAAGGGALLASLLGRSVAHRGRWPFGAALAAAIVGALVIAGDLYPAASREVHFRNAVFRAIARQGVHRAVVFVSFNEVGVFPTSLTQNPTLERRPDVLVLDGSAQATVRCVRAAFPERVLYRALGRGEITLVRVVDF